MYIFYILYMEVIFEIYAHVAQLVEYVLGKDVVTGSIPVMGSILLRP